MSNGRLAVVKRAWNFLTGGANCCPFATLQNAYKADCHPRVVSREKFAQNVYNDFANCMGALANEEGMITEEAFIEYYACASMVLPAERETYFCDIVIKTWGITADVANVHSSRIAQLEDIVFEKIRQRTHGTDDEGKTAHRIFKHFDLDGFGTIQMKEFACALETLGCVFPANEMTALFNHIDKNGSGKIDYEEFSGWFAIRGSGNNPNVNPVFGLKRDPPTQVLDKILQNLKAQGEDGVRSLTTFFKKVDKDGSSRLDRHEIQWVLRQAGLKLSPSEFERLFKYFDKNGDGFISYTEFVHGVRGELSGRKAELANQVCAKLTVAGEVNVEDLSNAIDFSATPRVKSGAMSAAQMKALMKSQLETHMNHGKISAEDFMAFLTDLISGSDLHDAAWEQNFLAIWAKVLC
jgi:calcyphosin